MWILVLQKAVASRDVIFVESLALQDTPRTHKVNTPRSLVPALDDEEAIDTHADITLCDPPPCQDPPAGTSADTPAPCRSTHVCKNAQDWWKLPMPAVVSTSCTCREDAEQALPEQGADAEGERALAALANVTQVAQEFQEFFAQAQALAAAAEEGEDTFSLPSTEPKSYKQAMASARASFWKHGVNDELD